jgi:4-hydroxythreonine-4-phosphate dehydrogenase
MPIRIAISMGDPSGIGAEVSAKALARLRGAFVPYLFGDGPLLAAAAKKAHLALPSVALGEALPAGGALVSVTQLARAVAKAGKPVRSGGQAQLAYLEAAFAAVTSGAADALCTAPVSKAQVQLADRRFVGHTEWLEARTGAARSVMMLAGARLRVALVTNLHQIQPSKRSEAPTQMKVHRSASRVEITSSLRWTTKRSITRKRRTRAMKPAQRSGCTGVAVTDRSSSPQSSRAMAGRRT